MGSYTLLVVLWGKGSPRWMNEAQASRLRLAKRAPSFSASAHDHGALQPSLTPHSSIHHFTPSHPLSRLLSLFIELQFLSIPVLIPTLHSHVRVHRVSRSSPIRAGAPADVGRVDLAFLSSQRATSGEFDIAPVHCATRLTSRSYVGTLVEINSEASTVSLDNVRSFGTEGRKGGKDEYPPSDVVYEQIVFRGSDVKDLRIEEPVKEKAQPAMPQDPAIIGVSL